MMIEAVKELSIVKEHLVKLQITINTADKISEQLNDMRLAHNTIDELLTAKALS